MHHEIAKDPVIKCLSLDDRWHYVVVLCMKCEGVLDRNIKGANRERVIGNYLELPNDELETLKNRLIDLDLIDKKWNPKGWDKRQYKNDVSTERVRKYRKNKETGNVTETLWNSFRNGPEAETEAETETDIKSKPKKTKKTAIKTPFEIHQGLRDYAKGLGVTSGLEEMTEKFALHHESKGSEFVSWDAAWKKWLRQDLEWKEDSTSSGEGMLEGLT